MPLILCEAYRFQIDIPQGWQHRQASIFGCGNVALLVLGLACLGGRWIAQVYGLAWLPSVLMAIGLILFALAFIGPATYAVIWFRSSEVKTGLPRLTGDIRNKGVIVWGPDGQWFHLTADELAPHERPMDQYEMESSFRERYSGRMIEQGWMAIKRQRAHWGTYRLGGKTHKKYTLYLDVGLAAEIEIVVTAKLGEPANRACEGEYDAVIQSICPKS